MTSLNANLVKRIERLPKPGNATDALQPLFEAISNAIHSTQDKFGDLVSEKGRVEVNVSVTRLKNNVTATVEDNGLGLDERNWDAFTTTDTDNKIRSGGKGVGRLLWLDCFEAISIKSVFEREGRYISRSFRLVLALNDQIKDEVLEDVADSSGSMFFVRFDGLRSNEYRDSFPGRGNYIFQHITSHFLPTFIGGKCPLLNVHVGEETRTYPDAINDIVRRRNSGIAVSTEHFGLLNLTLMECDKVASSDMKGSNFVHFIAHDRTVHSQAIDGKIGLKYFGSSNDRVFHAVLTGEYLDKNVNQERTAFVFEDAIIDRIINDVCILHIEQFLEQPLWHLRGQQRATIESIAATYPSIAFGDTEELQKKVPSGELSGDALYGHLSRERYRRDEKQADKIRTALERLKDPAANATEFAATIKEAGRALEESEQRSLAEYVVRRKVVLDFIELLLEKVRDDHRDSSYQREDILHSFICPVRVNSVTEGRRVEAASSHDLWIIDERLTFAQYFSSDTDFNTLATAVDSEERPDILIFDHVHGLRQTDSPSKILLVEFKRPGRSDYKDDENPQLQIQRYIRKLSSGAMLDVKGRPVELDENTIFYCFIVADMCQKIEEWTYHWQRTADGRGRILRPDNGFRGSIELIGWDTLVKDARARNQAFFDKAGITGKSFFNPK